MREPKDRNLVLSSPRRVPAGTVTFGTPLEDEFFQTGWAPRVDVGETSAAILVRVELPGLRQEDIQIEYESGLLTIRGQRESDTARDVVWHRREHLSGAFVRSFTLPATTLPDQITATYQDGILEVHVPKQQPDPIQIGFLPVDVAQAQSNLAARKALIHEFGAMSTHDLATSHVQPNEGTFSVRYEERELFPRFQFGPDGRPLPVIADVLALLRDVRSPWEIALWFTAANGWLGGSRPVDMLRTAPGRVVEAARREAEERVF